MKGIAQEDEEGRLGADSEGVSVRQGWHQEKEDCIFAQTGWHLLSLYQKQGQHHLRTFDWLGRKDFYQKI